MKKTEAFNTDVNYTEDEVIEALAGTFSMSKSQPETKTFTIYDTFDWRLYKASLLLCQSEKEYFLCELPNLDIVQRVMVKKQPGFARDFPKSPLKDQIEPLLEVRALLKLTDVEITFSTYKILNDDDKTVARLIFKLHCFDRTKNHQTPHVYLVPLKGYAKYAQNLQQQLEVMGFAPVDNDLFETTMALSGKLPGDYSTKLKFQLDPQMRSDEAAKVILYSLVDIIHINEDGVKRDIDPEFLHDYRVVVRQTRSALGQIKSVFPAEITTRYKRDFKLVGQMTNKLRDFDVYLMAKNSYKAMLPDILQDDIDPLFDYLSQKREKALEEVVVGLNSEEYTRILKDWDNFLTEGSTDLSNPKEADRPIIDLACERIYNKYVRIVKRGNRLLKTQNDVKMHSLRVQCKELRYMMEFFKSLFPRKQMKYLINQLKMLQSNLGDFNDYCIQEEYLLDIVDELPLSKAESRRVLLAIGSLVSSLHAKREQVRGEFAHTFTNFASPAKQRLFEELFLNHGKREHNENIGTV